MKKIIIISISVFTIIALLLLLWINMNRKEKIAENNIAASSSSAISSTNASLPPNTEYAKINRENVSGSIEENIARLESSSEPTLEIQFAANAGQNFSGTLFQFKSAVGITIPQAVFGNVEKDDFSIFSCKDDSKDLPNRGLILRFKAGKDQQYYEKLYVEMKKNIEAWEASMFGDLAPFLFSEKKISQNPIFRSTKYITDNGALTIDVRYGDTKGEDGSDTSIYYAVAQDSVYIFNDSKCLGKALDKYQPALEP